MLRGNGGLFVAMHLFAIGSLWAVPYAMRALLAGEPLGGSILMGMVLLVSLGVIAWVVRFWWMRRDSELVHGLRADECDRAISVDATGIREGEVHFDVREVLQIRVHECVDAGDGRTVACVQAVMRNWMYFYRFTRPLHIVIPKGEAARLSDAIVATLLGRTEKATEIRSELLGEREPPILALQAVRAAAIACIPAALALFALVHPIAGVLFALFLVVLPLFLLSTAGANASVCWRFEPDGLHVSARGVAPIATSGRGEHVSTAQPSAVHPYAMIKQLELHERHGVPFLVVDTGVLVVPAGRNGVPVPTRLTIVPGDWQGLEPEAFARAVAARLGTKFRDVRRARR